MKLILLQLNEINFDIVKKYINQGYTLSNFKKILRKNFITTSSEDIYENLEPWIQWVSVHTGLPYNDHKVFRLGDIVNHQHTQIFEKIEQAGFKVGAISPMNAKNNLKSPEYFIPDPWTQTPSDKSYVSKILSEAIAQAVNDNADSKLTISSIFKLLIVFILVIPLKSKISLALFSLTTFFKPWRKSLVLDKYLFEIHQSYFKKKNVNFSSLFLNAGAHIQHHYFFNSHVISDNKLTNPTWYIKPDKDPIYDMLLIYDSIIGKIIFQKDTEVMIATGLSQKPYNRNKFYYRLKNHSNFLKKMKIKFKNIYPRMTRDFLITFHSENELQKACEKIKGIKVNNTDFLFEEIEIRNLEIFVTLTYPFEILQNTKCKLNSYTIDLYNEVVFVAIKNGMHQSKGYVYLSDGIKKSLPIEGGHVSNLNSTILNYFNIN